MDIKPAIQEIEEYLQHAEMGVQAIGGVRKADVFKVIATVRQMYMELIHNMQQELEAASLQVPDIPLADVPPEPQETGQASFVPPQIRADYEKAVQQYNELAAQAKQAECQYKAAQQDYLNKTLYLSDYITQTQGEKVRILNDAHAEAKQIIETAKCESAAYLASTREEIRRKIDEGDRTIAQQQETIRKIKHETIAVIRKAGFILDRVGQEVESSADDVDEAKKKVLSYMPKDEDPPEASVPLRVVELEHATRVE